MVKELKKTREENIGPTSLNNGIKLFINRYRSSKDLLSNGLKLIKNNQKMGIFFALHSDNQKTWLEKEYKTLHIS